MAITISGENNNDRITAQDGVIDTISGFNISGIITASSFTGDLTGDVTGNVTGNINNSTLLLQTGSTERVRITSDGKISTGALASPDGNLHVYSSSAGSVTAASDANQLVLESAANVGMSFLTASNSLSRIKFGDSRQSNRGVIAYNHSDDAIIFHTVGSEKFRIASGGDLLIGRTTGLTDAKVSINCDAGESGIAVQLNTSTGTINLLQAYSSAGPNVASITVNPDATPDLMFNVWDGSSTAERLRIDSGGLTTLKNFNGTGLRLQGSGSDYQGMQLQVTDASASQTRNVFIDAVNETGAAVANQIGEIQADGGSNWHWSTQPPGNRTDRRVEALRITSAGRVGINESTPLGKLHVKSSDSGANVGASADELVLESSANTGMTILSGTTSEGAINFGDSGDNNIGKIVYTHNGNYMYFKTSDIERLRIDSNGQVFVGDVPSSGQGILNLKPGSGDDTYLKFRRAADFNASFDGTAIDSRNSANSANKDLLVRFNKLALLAGGIEKVRILSNGKVGIGYDSPVANLDVRGSSDSSITIGLTNGTKYGNFSCDSSATYLYAYNGNDIIFSTNSGNSFNRKMTIKNDGKIAFNNSGTVNATYQFDYSPATGGLIVTTDASFTGNSTAIQFRTAPSTVSGSITLTNNGTTTAYVTSSDYRLKENAVAISDGITRLKTLKPYRFNFKSVPDKTVDGFFAHEVIAVPEAIVGDKDEVDSNNNPVYQSMDYAKITPLLTAALQEAITEIETLKTKVAALEGS